ncbi:MAG: flagellar filament capping protein FliD [Lachnospiraceae bacterium]|nr:flagellar filament capping protein FliD [Lachnospiraceae bacterium]
MAIRISGMNSGLDTESIVSALVSSYATKRDKYVKAQTKLSWKADAYKAANTKVYDLYTSMNKLRFTAAYSLKKTTVSDSTKASITASSSAINGTQTLKINNLATAGYLTGGELGSDITSSSTLADLGYNTSNGSGTIDINGTSISVDSTTTISDFVSQLNDAGVTASFDATNKRIFVSSSDTGADNDFSLSASDENGLKALSSLGLVTTDLLKSYASDQGIDTSSDEYTALKTTYLNSSAARVEGENASITLNGADFESATNSFTVNGLTINATGETGDDEITITTATDVDGIYDTIKDFFTQYNEVVNYLQGAYNADSAKGYEPLTDDEKAEMTDTQVEKWEAKIKDSLLRRDSTIGNILNVMSNSMSKTYTINGSNYSLGSFGISTLGYFTADADEQYAYHIDGDEDDSYTSANADKLKAAINEDPDAVIELMKNVTNDLYTNLGNQMKSTSLSSAYTIYNDKEMANEYSDYTDLISTWEDRLAEMEDRYYQQFTAMEKALATLQSNSSALSGLLGS